MRLFEHLALYCNQDQSSIFQCTKHFYLRRIFPMFMKMRCRFQKIFCIQVNVSPPFPTNFLKCPYASPLLFMLPVAAGWEHSLIPVTAGESWTWRIQFCKSHRWQLDVSARSRIRMGEMPLLALTLLIVSHASTALCNSRHGLHPCFIHLHIP